MQHIVTNEGNVKIDHGGNEFGGVLPREAILVQQSVCEDVKEAVFNQLSVCPSLGKQCRVLEERIILEEQLNEIESLVRGQPLILQLAKEGGKKFRVIINGLSDFLMVRANNEVKSIEGGVVKASRQNRFLEILNAKRAMYLLSDCSVILLGEGYYLFEDYDIVEVVSVIGFARWGGGRRCGGCCTTLHGLLFLSLCSSNLFATSNLWVVLECAHESHDISLRKELLEQILII
mmetsp:Transcript_1884/g.6707  ORF Transcript_1884/g.6707 Transcript_1884/m.6707 type:complete len:233 (-) Transcript_1884:1373-2071(-)